MSIWINMGALSFETPGFCKFFGGIEPSTAQRDPAIGCSAKWIPKFAKDGLGFPENTKAAILRRGLQETSSLIQDASCESMRAWVSYIKSIHRYPGADLYRS